ncbi:MAG: phosphate regulon sensor histidine kinase PhoR [Burkholderiales bacterium]|nr:phosphate regulon sensor histidine kinase PhoR [Burkholderiales bacterium]
MKAAFRKGLVAPAAVAFATLAVWAGAGPLWALGCLGAGAAAVVGFHLLHLQRVTDWATGSLDADVPAGRGSWAVPFAAIHRRVRLRKKYQQELKQVIERFRRAAEAIPDGVVLLDARHHIQWANARAQALLGLAMPIDRGRPIVNLVRQPEFVRYVDEGEYAEPVLVEQSREPRLLSLQIVPFGVDETMLLARDVTQLEALARMRRDFIANVSHELKTPLTVVSGFIETLQDLDFEPRQRARYLGLMQDQARNMQRLVDDLLTLSALESEHDPPNDAEFAVVPLLLELSADAKALSHGEHEVALEIGEAAVVVGNRDELRSAFGNLVSNAIRYTPPGGTVTIGWSVDDDGRGRFAVTDTGIGIAPEHIPRLTERFYRVDRSRSRATGGTGLGLAIVKHVLLRHQAELEIASEPGRGSTFRVVIPARRVRRAPSTPPDAGDAALQRGEGGAPRPDARAPTSSAVPRGTGS